ncbi:DUF2922 domain-containing protein [Caldisericum sp.]|uniref:DUF2922 domain-containing protein n=1 Tax=Caldisericum sp. TaxID=2499687 RepID=UPI003D108936
MADTSATVLRLVFGTENGKTASMEFNNPKATVTQAQVQSLMQTFITKNVVNTKNGALTTILDGGIVTRSFTDLVP